MASFGALPVFTSNRRTVSPAVASKRVTLNFMWSPTSIFTSRGASGVPGTAAETTDAPDPAFFASDSGARPQAAKPRTPNASSIRHEVFMRE